MKFKFLLTSAAIVFAAFSASAATFYVSPEGAGEKTGADAANAMGLAEFRTHAAALKADENHTYIFAGGNYDFTNAVAFPTSVGPTLVGNTNGERTVFNAENQDPDLTISDKDRKAGILFLSATTGDQSEAETVVRPIKITDIDFCNLTTNKNANNGSLIISAIGIDNSGYVEIEGCNFKNNVSTTKQGGPAIGSNRSTLYVRNCTFDGNKAGARGGAVNLRTDKAVKGITVFENCLFKNNEVNGTEGMGGAVFAAQAKSVTFIGSTFTGNNATQKGSVLYANGHPADGYAAKMIFINSTVANNPAQDGAPIMMGNGSNVGQLYLMNNIIVEKVEARAATEAVITPNDGATIALTSGGYNYLGTVETGTDAVWEQVSDQVNKDYASIFGTHSLNGAGFIKPAVYVKGANGTEIAEATKDWGLPKGVNVENRESDVTPGAHGYNEETVTTGIADIAADANDVKIIALGGGNYQLLGYEGAVQVYSISGAQVLATVAPEVNLSSLAAGVYLVRAGKKVVKVVR